MRKPDLVIGTEAAPYLKRWYVIPRNRFFNIYLHQILRDDDDRALHDHPWWNISILLKGSYNEVMPNKAKIRKTGSMVFRRATNSHRLELVSNKPCWTLFITGPKVRIWGFYCPQGWIPWHKFVDPTDPGKPGKGCDQ